MMNAHAQDMEPINALINRYKVVVERPKSCPLESKKFADLLAKTESIKNVFKSNCLQKDDTKMTEVLSNINAIQDELKKQNLIDKTLDETTLIQPAATNDSNSTSSTSALSGIKFSNLFSNISSMIKKNQCNLEDGRVLEQTADLIYDSTQLGLLAGTTTGLAVAGGGFIISSAIKLIDLIFKQRFDFEKNKDRQTFIKLNCSFYDIRKDLEAQGGLDVESSTAREDLRDVKAHSEKLNQTLKDLDKEKTEQKKSLDEMDQQMLVSLVGDVVTFKKSLIKVKAALTVPRFLQYGETPAETQKLLMITAIAQDFELLNTQLTAYRLLKVSSIPMLDDVFAVDLKNFDPLDIVTFQQTMALTTKTFNDGLRSKILFHVTRILNDISSKEELASAKNKDAKKVKADELQKRIDLYNVKLAELKKIEERLNRIVSAKEYSATDDGTDNMVSLLENYKNISGQIYGEWGEKFLRYATFKSYEETKTFSEKIKRFNKKYGEQLKVFNVDSASSTFVCQDIQRIRYSYKYADSLVQEGYDFIVTNKDLFHTDQKTYYNTELDEENGALATSAIEKIQRHYKSTILAVKKLKNVAIDPDQEGKYLTRSWNGSSYLGRSMLDVSSTKNAVKEIQDKFEKLNCTKVLVDDIN
jgi:hypothetical protein